MPHYYIDALDPSGGSAFVSLREEGLLWTKPAAAEPVWYLSAPDFTPTPIGSRAIGFAATMRGHQVGLSVDEDTEVPFMTLESAAAFVRRLYLAGGGPGGDAGGPTPPPAPDGGEPPELPRLPETWSGEGILGAVLFRAQTLANYSENLISREGHTSELVHTGVSIGLSDGQLRYEGTSALENALNMTGVALTERRPPNAGASRVQWLQSLQAFWHLGSVLEQEYVVSREQRRKLLRLVEGRPLFPLNRYTIDPLDILARLPLPFAVGQGEHWESVADLFFGCIAVPSKLTVGQSGLRRSCLLFLAAYFLTSGGRISVRGIAASDRTALVAAEMRQVVVWLLDQMPDHAFAPEIENIFTEQWRVT